MRGVEALESVDDPQALREEAYPLYCRTTRSD